MIFTANEEYIRTLSFFDEAGLFLELGPMIENGRKETFELTANERLIGFELDHGSNDLVGITFVKWTI